MLIDTYRDFYVFVPNLKAKPVNLQNFLTVVSVSKAPSCPIHAHKEETMLSAKRRSGLYAMKPNKIGTCHPLQANGAYG